MGRLCTRQPELCSVCGQPVSQEQGYYNRPEGLRCLPCTDVQWQHWDLQTQATPLGAMEHADSLP